MKFALLFALLWVAAAVVATTIVNPPSPDVKGEYIPQRTTLTFIDKTPCRWDDLCNGSISPARLAAHMHDKDRP